MSFNSFSTNQESFWHGEFGNSYTDRNYNDAIIRANLFNWSKILRCISNVSSVLEIGCNRGLNLDAINTLHPDCSTYGVEINSSASAEASSNGHSIIQGSILDNLTFPRSSFDLVFTQTVLIHINPQYLEQVYNSLYELSSQYILIAEYFNPTPVTISYRGHEDRLFKRDFASELWSLYPDLKLVDYGFFWSKDPLASKDDINWFIFRK